MSEGEELRPLSRRERRRWMLAALLGAAFYLLTLLAAGIWGVGQQWGWWR